MTAALEARARRAAKRVGLYATKSSDRTIHFNNRGGFQLVNPLRNEVVAGVNYDLTAEDIIVTCDAFEPDAVGKLLSAFCLLSGEDQRRFYVLAKEEFQKEEAAS